MEVHVPTPVRGQSPETSQRFMSPCRVQEVARTSTTFHSQVHLNTQSPSPQNLRIDQIRKTRLGSRHGSPGAVNFVHQRRRQEFDLEAASAIITSSEDSSPSASPPETDAESFPNRRCILLRRDPDANSNDSEDEGLQQLRRAKLGSRRGSVCPAALLQSQQRIAPSKSLDRAAAKKQQHRRMIARSRTDDYPEAVKISGEEPESAVSFIMAYTMPLLNKAMAELEELDRDSFIELRRTLLGSRNGSVRRSRGVARFAEDERTEDSSRAHGAEPRACVVETRRSVLGSRNGSTVPPQLVPQQREKLRCHSSSAIETEREEKAPQHIISGHQNGRSYSERNFPH